jgi:RimJ/RimL family protein N-acetyltransferase
MPEPPSLTAARLRLRPLDDADAASMARLVDDIDVARMTTSIPHPFARADAQRFISRVQGGDPRHEAVFAIEHRRDGFMGVIALHPMAAMGPELGYWLGRPFWGRGLMTEAVRTAVDWAHRVWRKPVLESGHFVDNPASAGVLIKAGFLYTGVVKPRWSIARNGEAPTRMMVRLA